MSRYLKTLLWFFGVAHVAFGVAGTVFPRWFYATVPPWPPLHVGQIQIAGVFDLALAILFFAAATDLDRYLPIVIPVGVVAECGHALVRIGHVMAGDNPRDDLLAPTFMLLFGIVLLGVGLAARRQSRRVGRVRPHSRVDRTGA
jgi:uncharacterized membrane protein